MSFNSTILSENSNYSKYAFPVNENMSIDECIMEMNDTINTINDEYKLNYYRELMELHNNSIEVVNEANFLQNVKEKLIKILDTLIQLVKKTISYILAVASVYAPKSIDKLYEIYRKNQSEKLKKYLSIEKDFKIYHYPNILDIDSQKFRASMNGIVDNLNRVCNGDEIADVNEKSSEMAYRTLSRLMKKYIKPTNSKLYSGSINNASSFKEFINNDYCYITEKTMTISEFVDTESKNIVYDDMCAKKYKDSIAAFQYDLNNANKVLKNANFKTKEDSDKATMLVMQIKCIVESYIGFIKNISSMHRMDCESNRKILEKVYRLVKNTEARVNINFESGMIHGEEFNSDTLFDNDDIRDFNRTEWLDISLEQECYNIKYSITEMNKHIAINEALILSDDYPNKFNRLVAMREAEEANKNSRISNIISKIKEIINKYIGNIKERYNKNSKLIQRSMKYIKQPVTIKTMQSNGDILAGMYRIQKKINIIPFDYASMKEDLKDKRIFFEKRVLPNLKNTSNFAKRKIEWNENTSITDYCKAYFGASMPEDKYPKCVFNGKEIEVNMDNIVRFLNQANSTFSAKLDLNVLENESKKASNRNNTTSSSNENKTETKNESMYYSELFTTWITEAEIEMNKTENNSSENNTNNDEAVALKNYMDCYKDIILSKITASEFIVSELMQVVIAHAQSHMPNEEKKASTEENK